MELSQETFGELTQVIHRLCGLVIGADKVYLVRHRLEPLIRRRGLNGFDGLLQELRMRAGASLHDAIIEAITTKETSFFRDRGLFDIVRQRLLPECMALLRQSRGSRHRIRLWSAASSTGQEAFSLAMLVREFIETDRSEGLRENAFTILASDISAEALDVARAGRYSKSEVGRGLSEEQLHRYFYHRGDTWIVKEPVRRLVQFRQFNLLHSPADLGAFDIIFCRNVLIYFDEATRKRICRALCGILQEGGWLVLGAAESLQGIDDRLESEKIGRIIVYRKRPRAG